MLFFQKHNLNVWYTYLITINWTYIIWNYKNLFQSKNAHVILVSYELISVLTTLRVILFWFSFTSISKIRIGCYIFITNYCPFLLFVCDCHSDNPFLLLGASIVCVINLTREADLVLWFPDRTSVCTYP